jgi:uncharacterized phage protein (TIGR02220 family)
MDRGYIKLYRKILESLIFQNEGLFKLWIWCLLKASHKHYWIPVQIGKGFTEVCLKPGQFIFGREKAAKELKVTASTLWKRMLKLKTIGNLDIKSNNHYSLITIVNWDSYQGCLRKSGRQSDSQVTAEEQPGDSHGNTNKNIKNVKNEENNINQPDKIPYQEIITYLNQKTGKNFSHKSKETRRLIQARWNQAFRLPHFIQVIDTKCAKWLSDPNMIDYLRPQTLFGTKFESYLNEGLHPLQGRVSETTIKNIQTLDKWEPPDEK